MIKFLALDNLYDEKLVNAAIRFFSFRPRSEKELRDFLAKKLTKWKISGDVLLDKVVTRMAELGYVDDRKFARWWVEQRNTFRPKGTMLLVRELYQKGVDRDIVGEVLSGSKGSEMEDAKTVIEKKLKLLNNLSRFEKKKKLYGLLGRRGFSSETIDRVVDDVVNNEV